MLRAQFAVPRAVYHLPIEGRPVVAWFLEDQDARGLTSAEAGWLAAQRQAWLSVWEATEVRRGEGLAVRDLLSGETRFVHEVSGSKAISPRDAVLGRVVDFDGISVFGGMHGRALEPRGASVVVEAFAKLLREAPGEVPVQRLRDPDRQRALIDFWETAVEANDSRPPPEIKLQNTDGDPLLVTKDRFDVSPERRDEVKRRLAAIEHAWLEEDDDGARVTFHRLGNRMHKTWDNTVIGQASLHGGELVLETNSLRRADDLREQIERALAGLVRHRSREHADPMSLARERGPRPVKEARLSHAEAAALRQFKQKEVLGWLDEPLSALGGKTPREAVRLPKFKAEVDLLVKEWENCEASEPEGQRARFAKLRRDLGLEP